MMAVCRGRGLAGGAHSKSVTSFRRENAQDRIDDGGLADTRPARDHEHLATKRHRDSFFLAFCERQAGAPLDPRDSLVGIDPRPGKVALIQCQKPFRNGPLGAMETSKENAGCGPHVSPDRTGLRPKFSD
jgi:hypothetical protein